MQKIINQPTQDIIFLMQNNQIKEKSHSLTPNILQKIIKVAPIEIIINYRCIN